MIQKLVFGVLLVLSIGGMSWFLGSDRSSLETTAIPPSKAPQDSSRTAPNFVLKRLEGQPEHLIPNGKPTLINFWASWCTPCKSEMPMIQEIYEKYQDRMAFRMVNLTVDDDLKQVRQLIKKQQYTFPIFLDETGEASEVYQILSIPTTYLIDQKGTIRHQVYGALSKKQLETMIQSLLDSTEAQ